MKIWLCHFTIILLLCTSSAFSQSQRQLVEEGRRIFFEETFDGNGRTCGTCHPAEHNFTIDPEFIDQLPPSDPLFVHRTNPDLAELENHELLTSSA
jgi:cytochrome c peroxidase